jgi:hypothetical protein
MRRTTAFVHFIAGRYEEALVAGGRSLAITPQNAVASNAAAAASATLLGRMDQARAALTQVMSADPKLRLATLRSRFPIVRDDDFNRFAEALRLAGLPE